MSKRSAVKRIAVVVGIAAALIVVNARVNHTSEELTFGGNPATISRMKDWESQAHLSSSLSKLDSSIGSMQSALSNPAALGSRCEAIDRTQALIDDTPVAPDEEVAITVQNLASSVKDLGAECQAFAFDPYSSPGEERLRIGLLVDTVHAVRKNLSLRFAHLA